MARFALALALALAGLTIAPLAFAQNDLAERLKLQRQIADQKMESTVKEAMIEADKIAKTAAPSAVKLLKQMIVDLDLSGQISSVKRQELVKLVQAKIASLENKGPATPALDPKIGQTKEAQIKAFEANLAEAKAVKEGVVEIEKLNSMNKFTEAHAKVAELAKKYPNNPSVIILVGQGTMGDRVAEARMLAKEQDDRILYAMNDLARSALPAKGNMEFSADHKKRMELRDRLQPKLLGPEEEAILQSLEKIVKKGVKDAPFEETLQTLSNLINQPLYLDKKSLEDAGLDLRRPVSIPDNVTARTALRGILQSQGLTFILKDKVLQVVTFEKARENMVTRAYYLGDVIAATGPFSGAVTWGPYIDFQQTQANAQVIVDSITKSIDPLTWREKGGPSTVIFNYASMSLIVRAPAEVHSSLGSAFKR